VTSNLRMQALCCRVDWSAACSSSHNFGGPQQSAKLCNNINGKQKTRRNSGKRQRKTWDRTAIIVVVVLSLQTVVTEAVAGTNTSASETGKELLLPEMGSFHARNDEQNTVSAFEKWIEFEKRRRLQGESLNTTSAPTKSLTTPAPPYAPSPSPLIAAISRSPTVLHMPTLQPLHSDVPSVVPAVGPTPTASEEPNAMVATDEPSVLVPGEPLTEPLNLTDGPEDAPSPSPSLFIVAQQDASCKIYPACQELEGNCCPSDSNLFLNCCFDGDPATDAPVPSPTKKPTLKPTRKPTQRPTLEPTKAPITMEPTPSPTKKPTPAPSPEPSTKRPTAAPSPEPTGAPATEPPTNNPIPSPTDVPTVSPTVGPTSSPVLQPSSGPTTVPSTSPSDSPAPTKSPAPSPAPTKSFEFDMVTLSEKGVRMVLTKNRRRALQSSSAECTAAWQENVRSRIESEVNNVIPKLETLDVGVSNVKTEINATAVALIFDVLVQIRSPLQDHDLDRYIKGPFDTPGEKEAFAQYLKSTGCPEFANVGEVDVVIPKAEAEEMPKDGGGSKSSTGLIAGLSLAIAAILLLAATFIYVRMRNKKREEESRAEMPLFSGKFTSVASEVDLEENSRYDVSTLSDPVFPGTMRIDPAPDTSTLGAQSLEYDFQRAYADAQSTTESLVTGTIEEQPSFTEIGPYGGDDNPFDPQEEEFEVVAPAGLLGLIIESNLEDGRPTVHNVKPNSVLAHVVQIGDRLLAVDGQDVTQMRAHDVSQLIATKRDQEGRVLSLSRPKKQIQ